MVALWFYSILHVCKPLHLSLFLVDLLKFCCSFCDFVFVHSNFKVIQYLMLTIAFKLVLSQSSQILLLLCNPAILSLAVSCLPLHQGWRRYSNAVVWVSGCMHLSVHPSCFALWEIQPTVSGLITSNFTCVLWMMIDVEWIILNMGNAVVLEIKAKFDSLCTKILSAPYRLQF